MASFHAFQDGLLKKSNQVLRHFYFLEKTSFLILCPMSIIVNLKSVRMMTLKEDKPINSNNYKSIISKYE